MNKRGLELAISTIVLFVIGLAVLIGMILFFRNALGDFGAGTNAFLENSEAVIVRQACEAACETGARYAFCCGNKTVQGESIKCDDERLEIECSTMSCEEFEC